MTDYKQLCAELVDAIDSGIPTDRMHSSPLVLSARAALAEPEPEDPTDEELMALAVAVFEDPFATDKDYARAALARWGNHPGSPDSSTDLESRIENLEALVHELRVGYLRMANAIANQVPDRTKFFSDLTPDSNG